MSPKILKNNQNQINNVIKKLEEIINSSIHDEIINSSIDEIINFSIYNEDIIPLTLEQIPEQAPKEDLFIPKGI